MQITEVKAALKNAISNGGLGDILFTEGDEFDIKAEKIPSLSKRYNKTWNLLFPKAKPSKMLVQKISLK